MRANHNSLPALRDLSRQNAEKSHDAVAFEDATESVTWGEFEERSCRAANTFRRWVSKGDRVAFYCKPSVRHAVLYNGALKAGAATTNLHIRTAPDAFRYAVEKTRPRVIVVDQELTDSFEENATKELLEGTVVLTTGGSTEKRRSVEEAMEGASATEPDVLAEENDIVAIAWTSGSTGRPKGWCHTNRTMYLKGIELATRGGMSRNEKRLVVNKPSFLIWTSYLTRSMLACESTYYMREWDPERWLEVVDEHDITQSTLVPTMWRAVLEHDLEEYDLDSLTTIGSTGEKLSPSTLRRLREDICSNIQQSYGSTEIHSTVLYNNELTADRIESVGKPQSGTEVRIVNPNGDVDDRVPPNESGEIVVKSPDAPVWAWEDGDQVESAFEDGWWRSGDLGYKDEDGFLYIEGRIDFQIKSKGVKIVPGPIEEALTEHSAVQNAVVVGVRDEEYGQKVTAIVETTESVTEEELQKWCLDHDLVAEHERPREYHFVDSIERTPSGKLDRESTKEKLDLN